MTTEPQPPQFKEPKLPAQDQQMLVSNLSAFFALTSANIGYSREDASQLQNSFVYHFTDEPDQSDHYFPAVTVTNPVPTHYLTITPRPDLTPDQLYKARTMLRHLDEHLRETARAKPADLSLPAAERFDQMVYSPDFNPSSLGKTSLHLQFSSAEKFLSNLLGDAPQATISAPTCRFEAALTGPGSLGRQS